MTTPKPENRNAAKRSPLAVTSEAVSPDGRAEA